MSDYPKTGDFVKAGQKIGRSGASCVFCNIGIGRAPAEVVAEGADYIAFVPKNPATPGHVLFIPKDHIKHAAESPWLAARTFAHAATYLSGLPVDGNLITSVGPDATQSVYHLHVHVIPRGKGCDLPSGWPWRD